MKTTNRSPHTRPPLATSADVTINQVIELRMAEQGIKRGEMARALGIHRLNVRKALGEAHDNWKIATLRKWAAALDCDVEIRLVPRGSENGKKAGK